MEGGGNPHPVQNSLKVWKTARDEKRKIPARKFMDPQGEEGRIFSRLVNSYNYLRDPVEELIYPGMKMKRPKITPRTDREVRFVVRNHPITVPTCCSSHEEEVRKLVENHRDYLYNSPTPTLPCHNTQPQRDRLQHLASENLKTNGRRQLPFSTVVVRWRNTASPTRAYDTETLYDFMSEFGPITSIYTTSPSSAYVVFFNLSDSCDAITAPPVGHPDNRLYCYWLHTNMANKLFYLSRYGVRVHNKSTST